MADAPQVADNDRMPRVDNEDPEERLVEAEITKHTSVAGRLLIAGTRHMLPLWRAKKMREHGTARPVPKAVPSHPAPPKPRPPAFEGEETNGEEEEPRGSEESRTAEEPRPHEEESREDEE